jgi:Family of unknown function (DUF5723)
MTRILADLHGFFCHSVGNPSKNKRKIRANPLKSASSAFQWYQTDFKKRHFIMKNLFCQLGIFLLCANFSLHAQNVTSLLQPDAPSKDIEQEHAGRNPSLLNLQHKCLYLPSFGLNINHNAFSLEQLMVQNEGRNYIFLKNVLPNLVPNNQLNFRASVQTLGFSKGFGNWAIGVHHAFRSYGTGEFNDKMLEILGKGNAHLVGQTVDIQGNMYAAAYSELGFAATYQVQKHWTIGARIKILNGMSGIFAAGKGTLLTDTARYELKMNNNYIVKNYGMTETLPLISRMFSGNSGFALDLGATYADERMTVSIGVEDLGSIGWKKNIGGFSVNGNATYSGLKTNDFFKFDSLNSNFFRDTLKKVLNVVDNNASTNESLPIRVAASVFYRLQNGYEIGSNLYLDALHGVNNYAISIIGTKRIMPNWKVGLRYTIRNNTFDNIGLQTVIDLKSFHIYGSTDDLLTVFNPFGAKQASARIGVNVLLN